MGQSGVMNHGAFMDRLGGRMDDRRAALVDEAFDKLDTSGNGHLALDEVRRLCSLLFSKIVSPRVIVRVFSSFVRLSSLVMWTPTPNLPPTFSYLCSSRPPRAPSRA